MKKTKIIIPAMGMLLLGTAASVTGTVAWFSVNKSVSVTGMSVTTRVDSNLLVANSSAGTSKAADSAFTTYLDQVVTAQLQPSSSVDGATFFYTTSAKADGSKDSGDYTQVSNNVIPEGYQAYADYVLELKGVNSSASQAVIKINKLNLLYNNNQVTAEKAYRVAFFIQAASGANAYAAMGSSANMIYSMSGATYFTSGSAVDSTTTVDTVANLNQALNSMTVAAGASAYYKVTARLWLEGEDTTCNNTIFAPLNKDWKLNLGFSLDGSAEAVTNIGSVNEEKHTLTQTLTNVTSSIADDEGVIKQCAFSAKYTAQDGYHLPTTITVTVNGNALTADEDYTWNSATGILIINSQKVTNNVAITITGVANS